MELIDFYVRNVGKLYATLGRDVVNNVNRRMGVSSPESGSGLDCCSSAVMADCRAITT